jgi:hypothetical protein
MEFDLIARDHLGALPYLAIAGHSDARKTSLARKSW